MKSSENLISKHRLPSFYRRPQRRHQKVIEEAPSPAINETTRNRIGTIASNAVAEMGYLGLGTIEFLYENGEFFFIEMNTRLQVEHPITEVYPFVLASNTAQVTVHC